MIIKKKTYEQVDVSKREELIQKVMSQAYSIKEAAIELGINYSTAKHIVRVFKEQGTIKTKAQVKEEKRKETK